ncbi:MAG: hypothetical protein HN731_13230 [Rhodospirillaceae bacterium]|jgi:tripartite-type tricarboxylate transporter receptor subunit TctC|nr:hypothetical protein [Rhodospirillaceae bacterium]MBT7956151.1 hypothetical protein [Rhodospirillaceae bacterium]
MKMRTSLSILALGVAATFSLDAPAAAQGFYAGKQITLVVGASNRGTYAGYSRVLAIHMSKHIPGNPKIILSVKGGASGGMVAANFMNNAVPKDGTVMGITQQTIPVSQFLRPGAGRYDATKWGWIGNISPITNMVALWHKSPAQTLEEAKKVEVRVSATGKSSPTYVYPSLMNRFFGTKFKMITGYKGIGGMNQGMLQGETHARGASWLSVVTKAPHFIKEKKLKPIIQDGLKRDPMLPNVPTFLELAKTPTEKGVFELVAIGSTFGRSYFIPQGVPAARLVTLRKAFQATMKDPAFLAQMKKQKNPVNPMTGPELEGLIKRIQATKPDVLKLAQSAMVFKKKKK